MRIQLYLTASLFLFTLLVSSISFSKVSPKEKETEIANSEFDFTSSKYEVRKLQIHLVQTKQGYVAFIKALLKNGATNFGQVQCLKKKGDDYFCHRDDDGGSFTLQIGKTPRLMFTCFSTAEEGSASSGAIGCLDASPTTVDGKNLP